MVEQTHAGKCHCHTVLISRLDNQIVTYRSARLCYIAYAALCCAVDIIREWEERIGCYGNAAYVGKVRILLLTGKWLGSFGKVVLPYVITEYGVCISVGEIKVDDIVFIGSADAVCERQREDSLALAEMPEICLVTRKACAMYS